MSKEFITNQDKLLAEVVNNYWGRKKCLNLDFSGWSR